jgi:(1->4)-alpha-D-glucan 1-alpha-D-glucosylmutase
MYVPTATYRLQFGPSFGFKDAETIVPYLHKLGISDIYASPVFKANKGSTHGYDVTNPNELNPELGSAEEFSALTAKRGEYKIGWIQDIVPNHMAYSSDNLMLMDIFENGHNSHYADFFDIVWDHPDESLKGKILAPFLGKPYSEVLHDGEIKLESSKSRLAVRYYDIRFPLALSSYSRDESEKDMPAL